LEELVEEAKKDQLLQRMHGRGYRLRLIEEIPQGELSVELLHQLRKQYNWLKEDRKRTLIQQLQNLSQEKFDSWFP
jgi:cobalamin biosynthesis Mg chelatase CobN